MFNKHALKTGAMLAIAMGVTFTACKKDDDPAPPAPRSTSFDLKGVGADAANKVGAITVTENSDSTINVSVSLTKNTKDANNVIYFIGGTMTAPKTDTLNVTSATGTGAAMNIDLFKKVNKITLKTATGPKDTTFKYDGAVKYAAYVKVIVNAKDTLAIGNYGKTN
ncbi:hypothetical protein [Chitinophaga vietnamensis]|nr:hypothetical protein [Chitinophaga vietnamensis]